MFNRRSYVRANQPVIDDINITSNGVEKLLTSLKSTKAAGPDEIHARILKELAKSIAPGLAAIYRKSLATGIVPVEWKSVHIVPIFKKGQRYIAANYRPVSLTASKTMEHITVSNIMKYAEEHNLLY